MYYEEQHGGRWQRIEISGEMLTGRAHHVIYFATPSQWMQYPEWARHRRDEIIDRIKSEFQSPDYEYHGDNGLSNGHTTLPMKRATQQRQVTRADEPAMYWVSLGIYSTVGLGALGLGLWGLRERRRLMAG
jgi:hypothetical protein